MICPEKHDKLIENLKIINNLQFENGKLFREILKEVDKNRDEYDVYFTLYKDAYMKNKEIGSNLHDMKMCLSVFLPFLIDKKED